MMFKIALAVLAAAALLAPVRRAAVRLLGQTVAVVLGAVLVFLVVVALVQGF